MPCNVDGRLAICDPDRVKRKIARSHFNYECLALGGQLEFTTYKLQVVTYYNVGELSRKK